MSWVADILALVFIGVGLFFMFVGAVGVGRLPDVYNRLHAASKCSTLGLLGLLLGAVFHIGTVGMAAKAIMIMLFAFVATPVGSHMLAKAALRIRIPRWHNERDSSTEASGQTVPSQAELSSVNTGEPRSSSDKVEGH